MTYKQSQIVDFLTNLLLSILIFGLMAALCFCFFDYVYQKGMQDQREILKAGYQQAIDNCYLK